MNKWSLQLKTSTRISDLTSNSIWHQNTLKRPFWQWRQEFSCEATSGSCTKLSITTSIKWPLSQLRSQWKARPSFRRKSNSPASKRSWTFSLAEWLRILSSTVGKDLTQWIFACTHGSTDSVTHSPWKNCCSQGGPKKISSSFGMTEWIACARTRLISETTI